MSVEIYNTNSDSIIIIPVSSERFFIKYWDKAIQELNIKTLGNGVDLYRNDLSQILEDFQKVENWAKDNILGQDLDYILIRLEYIQKELPTIWSEEYPTLYMS